MVAHLREEEEVFFPAVKRIDAAGKSGAIPEMKDLETVRDSLEKLNEEDEEIGEAVHTIRRLSKEYEIPADACNTYMVTYRKLREFEEDLHKHVHLENNILFPKVVELVGVKPGNRL
jgi:regulator of cell morphogenesis and NO signaling